jgi:prevent-host-death family protein
MKTVGTFEGKTHFSRLVDEAERGETIIITRHGRPVAQLSPIAPEADHLSPEKAFSLLLAMDQPLGTDLRSLIEEGRRG